MHTHPRPRNEVYDRVRLAVVCRCEDRCKTGQGGSSFTKHTVHVPCAFLQITKVDTEIKISAKYKKRYAQPTQVVLGSSALELLQKKAISMHHAFRYKGSRCIPWGRLISPGLSKTLNLHSYGVIPPYSMQ